MQCYYYLLNEYSSADWFPFLSPELRDNKRKINKTDNQTAVLVAMAAMISVTCTKLLVNFLRCNIFSWDFLQLICPAIKSFPNWGLWFLGECYWDYRRFRWYDSMITLRQGQEEDKQLTLMFKTIITIVSPRKITEENHLEF